ncbi:GumC family protein [Mucilaginibacter arboris]|uniref:non-specific protein-tyrosine kinase n=1 Tax=Mucilaginibacter arboris TaxID=2682090 RepID=A0A7K1SXJ4_9SPHI|nr:tyrosine-protein kinase family protein [Mucilaginibacter arboris]MVN22049.1 polysaccharide biosynthesis tyrosine autokinase [Mucilaginibacter arboris]
MSTQPVQFTTFTIPEKKAQATDIKSAFNRYLYHWPLFILGLIIAMAGLFFYLKIAKPVYEIKASLQIKDEKKTPDQQLALEKLDLVNNAKIIENEIEVLKSKQLIGQVVQDLKLWVSYQKKEGFLAEQDLYKSTPIIFNLLESNGNFNNKKFNIVIKDKNSFYLQLSNGKLKELSFKDHFTNSFGTWKLEPTATLPQYQGETIVITLTDPDNTALQYQKAIDVSLSNKLATTLALSLNDAVPQRGKDILNRLIYNYNLSGKTEKNRETKSTLDFIDQRLSSLSSELAQAEKEIEDFKSSRGLTDISSDSKISLENMQANDTRLNEVNVQLSVIDGIENYINSSKNTGRAPATLGITDPALTVMIGKLSELQLQHDKLLATTPETNPDFEAINNQIQTTRNAIRESVRNIRASLLSSRQKLQGFNAKFESSIKGIPTQEREYVSMKRQQEIKENLYTYLLQKREEVAVSYASTIADDRIVDYAYSTPAKSNQSLAFAAALALGLGLPAGLIYARNSLSNKITSLQEIKDQVTVPVIAELPFEASKNPIVINSGATAISEQFRALRTKMHYLYGEKESGRVTLLTSSIPSEGKSFVSSNLALALAYSGRKTIVLELDLRKPQLTKTFNLFGNRPGITDYILGKADLSAIIQASGLDQNLDLIGSGINTNNPSELLERKQLKDLILSLQNIYDDIIIDSPPVHLVPDAMILSRLTDQTLYMVRQGFTEKSELNFIKELNDQKQLTNLNLIFNGIERIKYGYGYKFNNKYYSQGKKSKIYNSMFSNFFNRF